MTATPLPLKVFAETIADLFGGCWIVAPSVNEAGTQVVLFGDSGVDLGYDETELLHIWFHFDGVEPGDCVEVVYGPLYTEDKDAIAIIAETVVKQFQ